MRSGQHRAFLAAGVVVVSLLSGCESPSDTVFDQPAFSAVEQPDGRYRVTFSDSTDVVRGFSPDGRLLFRTRDLAPFGEGWVLLSVPPEGGRVREEVAVYRQALRDGVAALGWEDERRVLAVWKSPTKTVDGCPDSSQTTLGTPGPAPVPPTPLGVSFFALGASDGTAIPNLASRYRSTNVIFGSGTLVQRVRVTPALRDARARGSNPFGPALLPGSDEIVYSDGERLWQASMAGTSTPPVSLGEGAFPAVSADGRFLAYARPLGIDSASTAYVVPVTLGVCVQTQVEITASAWEVVLRDRSTGDEQVLGDGVEPTFDPLAPRLVVRTSELSWVDLETGERTAIATTYGASTPAISPDGRVLAFSQASPGAGRDVYYLLIDR